MTIYSHISSNKWKTWFIMFFFVIFVITFSYIISLALGSDDFSVAIIMLIISGLISFLSFFYSDKIVLTLAGAKLADKATYRKLYTTVENLSIASGLPMPKVYVIEDRALNAFATGRDPKRSAVATTSGLLTSLTDSQLEGVIGHEMSHIKNFDTRLMGVVAVLVGTVSILADMFFRVRFRGSRKGGGLIILIAIIFAILAPVAATIIQLAISRRREYLADADGALLTRYPEGLASALEKISKDSNQLKNASTSTAHLYIANPFKKNEFKSWFTNLFNTHPPVDERIKLLRSM